MRRVSLAFIVAAAIALPSAAPNHVQVTVNEAARRVDITIDGKPFTSYIWPDNVMKPVLYPIRDAAGTLVTRGWPLDPRPGEPTDHPHHVGMWLNYENVNGIDFWNNSTAIKPANAPKMGTILHRKIDSAKSGNDRGELVTESDWVLHDGTTLLHERTEYAFAGDTTTRTIDRTTTLSAAGTRVIFADAKDGMLGLRVARQLQQPGKAQTFTDAAGRATRVSASDADATGKYLTSEGKTGDEAWGTRGRWCALSGNISGTPITIAILDYPKNPGYPTYWHARGYGLFAANPLGEKAFSNGKEALNFTLEPGQSATFRYRVLVIDGPANGDVVERDWKAFAGK
jgi:methane monooxygenase PmoA-like